MSVAFQPKGDVAEWQLIYDQLVTMRVGQVVSYNDLTDILGRDFLPARGPFHKANRKLLETRKRGLLNVKNVGYRVVTAAEHEMAARSQHRFANRRLRRARDWIENTDRNELPEEIRQRFDQLEAHIGRQIDFTRRLDGRLAKVEKATQRQAEASADAGEKLAKLIAALERHGINIDD